MDEPIKIKEATRKRCKIQILDDKQLARFVPISLDFFHFIYQAKAIDFPLYFRAKNTVIEYIRPSEFGKQLLDEMWDAAQKPMSGMRICVLVSDRPRFDALINSIRSAKISGLHKKLPGLDAKTLDLYDKLSSASQMIVSGGLDANVMDSVKASASLLVTNAIDSDAAVSTLSRMITCDPTLYDHSATVAMIASVIALKQLPKPLTNREAEVLSQCALYHDLGKSCVPSAILNKPGKFTPEEYEIIKQHTVLGGNELIKLIDSGATIDKLAARVATEHHEKWDGTGYPYGRKGALEKDEKNGIHIYSRIVTIADIYSALLMKRVYKAAFEPQDAIKIMAAESAGFDPDVFVPFLRGVVHSLNAEQERLKAPKGRILIFGDHGLTEWNDPQKKTS